MRCPRAQLSGSAIGGSTRPTICRDAAQESFVYYHVELDAHDIPRAEGLQAESWLDTGNRSMFDNASVVEWRALFEPPAPHPSMCAPLAESGPIVDAVRARLMHRAALLGHTVAAAPVVGHGPIVDAMRAWLRRRADR